MLCKLLSLNVTNPLFSTMLLLTHVDTSTDFIL